MDAKVNNNLVVMDSFLSIPSNYTYRIKGMQNQLQVSYPKTEDCQYSDFHSYYKNLECFPNKVLTAKDEYAQKNYRSHYYQIGQELKPIDFDDAISSINFKLNKVAHLKANWTSVIRLHIPGLGEPFPIYLNHVLNAPDTFPFLPNISKGQTLFNHLTVSIDRLTTLEFVELGEYDQAKLPNIVYYDDQGNRTVMGPTTPANEYFTALVDYFGNYVLNPLIHDENQLSSVMLPVVFELLQDHLLKSLKAATLELIKRSPLLCNPTSEYLYLLPCGVNSKRKTHYEQIRDFKLISMGNGSIEVNSQIRSCEWVEYKVKDLLLRRVKIRAVSVKGQAIYQVREFQISTKL